jgi:hypothetical protein
MSPAQQSAFEALIGRPFSDVELATVTQMSDLGQLPRLTSYLSSLNLRVQSHFASERGLMERFPGGPLAADALLTKLEQASEQASPFASLLRRALKFLAQPEGLDIGAPATQAMLTQLAAANVITAVELAGLRHMATSPKSLTEQEVRQAWET